MQSKMTEKEFRRKLDFLNGQDSCLTAAVVRLVTGEAGLELAPEPVVLPPVIEARGSHIYLAPAGGGIYSGVAQMEATIREAAARYNSYPGLRAVAEKLVFNIRDRLHPATLNHLAPATLKLEDELAKGPKP